MKKILLSYNVFEIETKSTASIPRLFANFISEVESFYEITFFTFNKQYADSVIKTAPVFLSVSSAKKIQARIVNNFFSKKKVKLLSLKIESMREFLNRKNLRFDIIITPALDEISFYRKYNPAAKIVYWVHGISALYNKAYLSNLNYVDYLWSPTKAIALKINELMLPKIFSGFFEWVPNWIDPCFEKKNNESILLLQKKYALTGEEFVFIFCGGNVKLKGKYLIEKIFANIAKLTKQKIVIFLAGEDLVKEEWITGDIRVVYVGTLDPEILSDHFRISHFGLFPSLGGYEHAPLSILEMIASGVLPISSNVGGIKDILGEDYRFLISIPQSADEWYEKIIEAMQLNSLQRETLILEQQKFIATSYKKRSLLEVVNNID